MAVWSLFTLIYVVIFFASFISIPSSGFGQQAAIPSSFLHYKQPDQYYLQNYFTGVQPDIAILNPLQQVQPIHNLIQDYHHKSQGAKYGDELPALTSQGHLEPPNRSTINHQTVYYPINFGHGSSYPKDLGCTDINPNTANKIMNIANALARNPKPENPNPDKYMSASQIHQQICPPPSSPSPSTQTSPPKSSYPPTTTPCPPPPKPSSPPTTTPYPPTFPIQQTSPCPPTITSSKYETPSKTANPHAHLVPASKIIPSQNLLFSDPKSPYENRPGETEISKNSCIPVSPLHPASKHIDLQPSIPYTPPKPSEPLPTKIPLMTDVIDSDCVGKKSPTPVTPAERPIVHNPFTSDVKNSHLKVLSLPDPKGILHHRLHADEHEYPEAYASATQEPIIPQKLLQQMPYLMNYPHQTIVSLLGQNPRMTYPYVPPPITQVIPLIVPPGCQDTSDDYHYVEDYPYDNSQKQSDRFLDDKSWSRDILHDIAERMGVQIEDGFRGDRRFSSRRYPERDRGYDEDGHTSHFGNSRNGREYYYFDNDFEPRSDTTKYSSRC